LQHSAYLKEYNLNHQGFFSFGQKQKLKQQTNLLLPPIHLSIAQVWANDID
jgi:hypothetical protein